jgi:hypothetical protein
MGHTNLDVLDNCYILLGVWVCLFGGQKEGIFFFGGGFVVEILLFISFRKFTKFSMPKHGKRNHDLDIEYKSQGVFLQFWISTFLSLQ